MKPDISFITINYNSAPYTQKLIDSIIKETKGSSFEIIVVDNNSRKDDKDAISNYIQELSLNNISFLPNSQNCGFACGNMYGFTHAKGKYLFFINNDTELLNDAGTILKNFLKKNPNTALATAEIYGDNMQIASSYKLFPSLTKELFGNTVARLFNRFPSNKAKLKKATEVEVISGSCMFFERKLFETIEGFDENFFLYCEEEDISKRVWIAGKKVMFVPEAKIYHKGGGSAQQNFALLQEYYISYTYLIFKHFNPLTASLLYLLMVVKILRRSLKKKYYFKLFLQALQGFKKSQSLRYHQ
jgi:GT2 family glycosyltransferase